MVVASFFFLSTRPVYMIDFAVTAPPDDWKVSKEWFVKKIQENTPSVFTDEASEFQQKIITRSGLGDETYLPPVLKHNENDCSMEKTRWEFEQVVYPAIEELLAKSGVKPHQIGVLVVNVSLFNPTPSTAAMIINHFKLRSNIISYSLGGMGCSASPISIDLARQMLQLYPNTYALVVSTESITQAFYRSTDKSMLLPNCLFRCGAAAVLLSNRRLDGWRAKYELLHTVRTHLGASDDAYNCIYQRNDAKGTVGVSLSKELMAVAGEALKTNITTLGPLVLPVSEQLLFFANLITRKVGRALGKRIKPYIPDFNLAFDHVCIHTGGRAVIDEIEKQLHLTPGRVQPSRYTLYRYGNTSSSSIWYTLANIETLQGVRRGDRIWQMGFGSGFKCNSAVWRACRRIGTQHAAWKGFDAAKATAYIASLVNHHKPVAAAAAAKPAAAAAAAVGKA